MTEINVKIDVFDDEYCSENRAWSEAKTCDSFNGDLFICDLFRVELKTEYLELRPFIDCIGDNIEALANEGYECIVEYFKNLKPLNPE